MPAYAQFSDDGWVVAFVDSNDESPVCVADARGVHTVGAGEARLSRDGAWLLVLTPRNLGDYAAGTTTAILGVFGPYDLEVVFEPGPNVTLLNGSERQGWAFSPALGWRVVDRPAAVTQSFNDRWPTGTQTWNDNPMVLSADGWNARRTIWIRPDGSTIELLRHNSMLPEALILTVLSPLAIVPGYGSLWGMGWVAMFEDAQRQYSDKEQLRKRVAQVRAAAGKRGGVPAPVP